MTKFFTYLFITFLLLQLSSPREGWKNKVSVPFKRGGEYGDRGNDINELIARCI